MTRLASGSKSVLSKNSVMGMRLPQASAMEQSYTYCLYFVSAVADKPARLLFFLVAGSSAWIFGNSGAAAVNPPAHSSIH
jgi:hypothetical protein